MVWLRSLVRRGRRIRTTCETSMESTAVVSGQDTTREAVSREVYVSGVEQVMELLFLVIRRERGRNDIFLQTQSRVIKYLGFEAHQPSSHDTTGSVGLLGPLQVLGFTRGDVFKEGFVLGAGLPRL